MTIQQAIRVIEIDSIIDELFQMTWILHGNDLTYIYDRIEELKIEKHSYF